jgi:proteic killer suppression protein
MSIESFKDKNLRKFFEEGEDRKIPSEMRDKISTLLDLLDAATSKKDLNVANFHELKGDRKGTFSWTVTGNYRMTFRFDDGEAFDVDLEDYH